jgi:hypothetical protein
MKMKHLKTFENFSDPNDMGRFTDTDSDEQEWIDHLKKDHNEEEEESEEAEGSCNVCGGEGCPKCKPEDEEEMEEEEEEAGETGFRRKVWGDEVIEKKKFNFEKKGKKEDKKEDKKEVKSKGLTAKQKKLPEGLRKAIEKKKGK